MFTKSCYSSLQLLSRKSIIPLVLFSVMAPLSVFASPTAPVTGRAVIYSDSMNGKEVAMKGEHYDKGAMTAATHAHFPMGSSLKVTNLENNKSVVVKVNDRMNPSSKSVIDLSMKAAEELGMVQAGHVRVKIEMEGK